jgi:hypothetical protein
MPWAARSFALVEWPPAHNRIVPRAARYQDEGHCSARAHHDGRCTVNTASLIPQLSATAAGGAMEMFHRLTHHRTARMIVRVDSRYQNSFVPLPTKTIGILASGSLAARQQHQIHDNARNDAERYSIQPRSVILNSR